MIITIFSNPSEKNQNELVVTGKKLINSFSGLVTNGLGPDMARGPPVLSR
jgi:hypothetical protein